MTKADKFDKWFKSTYPEYCCGEAVIEPYYSIASYAWECAEQKQEKIVTELETELTKKADTNHSLVEQMADLESENAELKRKYFNNITDCDWCDNYCNSQLNKAKEIIKNLLEIEYPSSSLEECKKAIEQAEQFLMEIKENE